MNQVSQVVQNAGFTTRLRDKANAIGMISKISGRFISFYADDLASMILEDILTETAIDMNRIEEMTWTVYAGQETKVFAEDMIVMINSF